MEDLNTQDQADAKSEPQATSAIPISEGMKEGANLSLDESKGDETDGQPEAEAQGETAPNEPEQPPEPLTWASIPGPQLIQPTIGRRVWYWPSIDDIDHAYDPVLKQLDKEQAFDAGIVFVHDDRRVNLSVKDHFGKSFARLNVPLIQEGDAIPSGGGYAAWMPYQKASAARK